MKTVDSDSVGVAILGKVQRRIIPLLAACWFIAYIDRFNLSFAALQMNEDLGLSQAVFGLGAGLFFLGYAIFEVPSNVVLARVGARRWLARIMITWGALSAAMMLTSDAPSFYVLRFLLGVAEAGCFPGIAYYLVGWLSPRERTAALASIATMSMVSGIAGGPLAASLLVLDGALGIAGWQWLFLLEGLPAILLGIVVGMWLPDSPEKASWLSDTERQWLRQHNPPEPPPSPSWSALKTVVRDRRYWIWATAFFLAIVPGSALRLFQPTILRELTGLSITLSALLTAIPAAVGVIAIVVVGRLSTRHDERRWHAAVPIFIGGIGLALVGVAFGVIAALVVTSIATIGVAMQPPLFASVSAASRGTVNAVGIAFVNSVASLGGFVGPYLVGYMLDRTGGLGTVCLMGGIVMFGAGFIVLLERSENRVPERAVQALRT
jgi:MFS transporter, ACS family, tartrate transporter